jgi:hypothetical protein
MLLPEIFPGIYLLLKATARKPAEAIKYRSGHIFFMLSKNEQEFLNNPSSFNSNYQRSCVVV